MSTLFAAKLSYTIKKGDDSAIGVSFTDPNNSGIPLDLSQFTDLKMQVKIAPEGDVHLFELNTGNLGLSIGGTNSEVLTIVISRVDSTQRPGTYFYDVQGIISGELRTILEGKLKIEGDVTR